MKTVTGKILSSTPISVSKAARTIAKFAATDNGASLAISAYLRRASAGFNELKQLHKELQRSSKSDRKDKKSKSEATVEGAGESSLEPSVFNLTRGGVELTQEASQGYSEGKKHKNKKKKENGEVGKYGSGEGKIVLEDGESRRNKEKNEVGNFVEDVDRTVIDEHGERKKHKKKKEKSGKKTETFQENGVNIQEGKMINGEQREREKKKRKSTEMEGTENNSSEPRKKKKKKIKNEGDD
ncbi:hypothetical protein CCACVL1_20433 [Corchorus capsularis]|uniref:Uncharacterized protein n=1 Tax=Corchorus capsularis TaxID=210143 RepID=A0A1R3HB71_COCAP|nr:hypothetical protein CCACVL1_20433 [Corchorus capsularis]